MMRGAYFLAWIGLWGMAVAGCGSGGPETYPVTGKLSIKGQSAKGVQVTFAPVAPGLETASGVVGEDGAYTLYTGIKGTPGAMAGKYKVVLAGGGEPAADPSKMYMAGGGPPKPVNSPVPDEYTSPSTSPKEVEVKPESNTINIEI